MLLPEPVGRLIRRAKVVDKDGMTFINNPYEAEHGEFIRSTDPYFRPVYTTTGPDGCLYIVDMYRGIIQEGEWTKPGSYLRKVRRSIRPRRIPPTHGRIWRAGLRRHEAGPAAAHARPDGRATRPVSRPPERLVARPGAKKLIVLRQDQSVRAGPAGDGPVPAPNPTTRMHALWTLEGLHAADSALVREKLKDPDPYMRVAAIRVSESLFKAGDLSLKPDLLAMTKDPAPMVALQVVETAKVLKWAGWQNSTLALIASNQIEGVQKIGKGLLYEPRRFDPVVFNPAQVKLLTKGQGIYQGLCFACHGVDGHGTKMDGQPPGTTLAPPLAGSKTVLSPHESMVALLLHGVTGPIHGKSYDSIMPPQGTNDDEWVAAIVSYVRNSFGNNAPVVSPQEVAAVRAGTKNRLQPWTLEELQAVVPQPLPDREQWKATASENADTAALALDGKADTRYTTHVPQHPGEWYQVELPQEELISGLTMEAGAEGNDYPRGYTVEVSADGTNWGQPVASGKGTGTLTEIAFEPVQTRFVRITQTGGVKSLFWSITELQLLTPPKGLVPTTTMAKNVQP